MILKKRNTGTFYTDYEIKVTPDGTPEIAKFLSYAPFYIMEDFLPPDMLDEIVAFTAKKDNSLRKGSVIGYSNESSIENNMRDSSIYFLEDEEFEKYNDYIAGRISEINKNVYALDLTCFMTPQYTVYDKGQHFNWHPDGPFGIMDRRGLNCIPEQLQWRKLSLSIALNDESEYAGGDFQILNPSSNPTCGAINTVRMSKGTAILFPAFSSHRVSPVTNGVRKSLIYWFCGPRWR
jgi:PKHD-type hydroxylase